MDQRTATTEPAFLAAYDPRAYAPVAVTVDVAVLTIQGGLLSVLLVQRANPPFAQRWCLPGGFIKPDAGGVFPDLASAASARLALEAGITSSDTTGDRVHLEQLGTFGGPGRDPRMHVVSVAHLAFAPDLPDPVAGSGTLAARWIPVRDALAMDLAFDHNEILTAALARVRGKIEYTTVATAFLPERFTIGDLQRVYEAVWGERLVASGFRRKVHATKGFVTPVTGRAPRHGTKGGRTAQLYRSAGGEVLLPPILSQATRKTIR